MAIWEGISSGEMSLSIPHLSNQTVYCYYCCIVALLMKMKSLELNFKNLKFCPLTIHKSIPFILYVIWSCKTELEFKKCVLLIVQLHKTYVFQMVQLRQFSMFRQDIPLGDRQILIKLVCDQVVCKLHNLMVNEFGKNVEEM